MRDGCEKLAQLREYAERRPVLTPARNPHAVRREHNAARLTSDAWKGKRCFVCADYATQEHHIIQIQHGGTNRPLNKVWVCTPCHKQIHPFLADPPKDAPVGVVPFVRNTEQPGTCPACHQAVKTVKPVLKKSRYVSQSTRPIMLRVEALPPYKTTDLHHATCAYKTLLNRFRSKETSRLARTDAPAPKLNDLGWSTSATRHAMRQARG